MALSERSNRGLARFWGVVLGIAMLGTVGLRQLTKSSDVDRQDEPAKALGASPRAAPSPNSDPNRRAGEYAAAAPAASSSAGEPTTGANPSSGERNREMADPALQQGSISSALATLAGRALPGPGTTEMHDVQGDRVLQGGAPTAAAKQNPTAVPTGQASPGDPSGTVEHQASDDTAEAGARSGRAAGIVASVSQARPDPSTAPPSKEPMPLEPEPVRTGPRFEVGDGVASGLTPAPSATASLKPEPALTFRGPVMNQTMQQGGQLALKIQRRGDLDDVVIEFHASAGLIGSGKLSGKISPDGRISAVGRLLMGRNPFDCVLRATSEGEVLKGGAIFTHVGANASSYSTFVLARRT